MPAAVFCPTPLPWSMDGEAHRTAGPGLDAMTEFAVKQEIS
jgi:hypothetical protein